MKAGRDPRPSHVDCVDCGSKIAVKKKGPVPTRCAPCAKANHAKQCNERAKANPEKVKIYKRRCYEKHADSYRAYGRQQALKYYRDNRDSVLKKSRELPQSLKDEKARKIRLQRQLDPDGVRERERKRYSTNMNHRIATVLRARMTSAIKSRSAGGSLVRDLGISISAFMDYIEKQFSCEMNWSNYGEAWELDHIYPLSKADLSDRAQFLAVANYRNYQPLTPEENMAKKDAVTQRALELFSRLVSSARRALRENSKEKPQTVAL
jgi:hypothetical protein